MTSEFLFSSLLYNPAQRIEEESHKTSPVAAKMTAPWGSHSFQAFLSTTLTRTILIFRSEKLIHVVTALADLAQKPNAPLGLVKNFLQKIGRGSVAVPIADLDC